MWYILIVGQFLGLTPFLFLFFAGLTILSLFFLSNVLNIHLDGELFLFGKWFLYRELFFSISILLIIIIFYLTHIIILTFYLRYNRKKYSDNYEYPKGSLPLLARAACISLILGTISLLFWAFMISYSYSI